MTFLYPQLKGVQKEKILPIHIYFGLTGYILAIAAALLGISEKASFHMYVKCKINGTREEINFQLYFILVKI